MLSEPEMAIAAEAPQPNGNGADPEQPAPKRPNQRERMRRRMLVMQAEIDALRAELVQRCPAELEQRLAAVTRERDDLAAAAPDIAALRAEFAELKAENLEMENLLSQALVNLDLYRRRYPETRK